MVKKLQYKAKHGTPAVKEAAAENLAYMEEKYENPYPEHNKASTNDGNQFPGASSHEGFESVDKNSLKGQSSNSSTNRVHSNDPYKLPDYSNGLNPKKLKQAMIVKEILDKPKSLQ